MGGYAVWPVAYRLKATASFRVSPLHSRRFAPTMLLVGTETIVPYDMENKLWARTYLTPFRSAGSTMRKEYDFANMKGRKNPYAKALKKQVTLRLGVDVIKYFKELAKETGIPYQNLINLYLRECVHAGKKPALSWAS